MLTVSDTRTEADDKSGKILVDNLTIIGHSLAEKTIFPDNIYQIRAVISFVCLVLAVLVKQDGVLSKINSILAIVLVIWRN